MTNYYIGDLHLGHLNAITKFDHRPFKTVEDQDKAIIENINKIVTSQDNLYFLGDISWYTPSKTADLLEEIKCKNLFLLRGNHDRIAKDGRCKKLFQGIYDIKQIEDNGRQVILCHYPIMMWAGQHRGTIHIYGHVHNSKEERDYQEFLHILDERIKERDGDRYKPLHAYNVGCMCPYMDYVPKTLNQIVDGYNTWVSTNGNEVLRID